MEPDLPSLDPYRLDPADFQRLALDLLRLELAGRARVVPFDLPVGVNDGGFDGLVEGEVDGHAGSWRVEVKRVPTAARARDALREVLGRHPDRPLVYMVAAPLTARDREELAGLARERGVRLALRDGAYVAAGLREHRWLREWFVEDRREALLRPVSEPPPDGVPRREPYPSEEKATEAVVHALSAANRPSVLVWGPALADPEVVLHAAARRACAESHVAAAAWLVRPWEEGLPAELCRRLGARAADTLVLVRGEELAGRLFRSEDGAGLRLGVAVRGADAGPLESAARGRRRPVERVDVVVPSRREQRDRVVAAPVGSASEWEALLQELGHADWVERWTGELGDLIREAAAAVSAQALEAAAWAALLSNCGPAVVPGRVLDGASLDAIHRAAPHVDPASLREAEAARLVQVGPSGAAGVSQRDLPQWAPLGPGLGLAIVLAWIARDEARALAALRGLAPGDFARAVAWLVPDADPGSGALRVEALERGRRVAAEAMARLSAEEREALWALGQVELFRVDETYQRQAFDRLLRRLLAGHSEDLALLDPLLKGALTWPVLVPQALELILAAARLGWGLVAADRRAEAWAERLVNPAEVPPGYAVEGLRWFHDAVQRAPGPLLGRLAAAALGPWLSGEPSAHRSRGAWLERVVPAPRWEEPAWARGLDAAAGLLTRLLGSGELALVGAGLEALAVAAPARDRPADALTERVHRLGDCVAKRLAEGPRWAVRLRSEATLVGLLRSGPDPARAARWLDAFEREPAYLAWKHVVGGGPRWDRVDEARARLRESGPRAAYEAFEHLDVAGLAGSADPIAEQLVRAAVDLEALLAAVERELPVLERLGLQPRPSGEVLVAWARVDPAPFEAVLAAGERPSLSRVRRGLLREVLAGAFPERVRAALGAGPSRPAGYAAELARFLARPERSDLEDAWGWVSVLERVTLREPSVDLLYRLAGRAPASLKPALAEWLARRRRVEPAMDPRDEAAVIRALLGEPTSALVLRAVARVLGPDLVLPAPEVRGALVGAALRVFSPVAGEGPWEVRDPELAALLPWVAQDEPEAWWGLRWRGWALEGARDRLGSLTVAERMALLACASEPDAVVDRVEQAWAFDVVVGAVLEADPGALIAWVDSLPPAAPRRVRLLRAAGPRPALIPALERTLDALGPRSPGAARLAGSIAVGVGTAGFKVSRPYLVEPFPDHEPAPAPDALAEAYAEAGRRRGGPVGELLTAMADLRQGRDSPALRDLLERARTDVGRAG